MPRPLGGHVFPPTGTIFKLIQDMIGTNLLTKFHDDRSINVASRVLTRKKAALWWPYIIRTNLLTKFHEDWKINLASRVLTRKNAPPPAGHVFQPTSIILELVHDIIGMNLLTKFHENLTINVASTCSARPPARQPASQPARIRQSNNQKNAQPLGSHVFQANVTIFELIQEIIETNLLTKFHEDWTINVASKVFTMKNSPPLGSHVFQATILHIIETNLLTKFHEYWTINVASRVKTVPPPGGHVFSPIWTIFELGRDANDTNVLTRFHDDWAKIVTSRVFTRNTAPPPGGHLHEDWASNVTSTHDPVSNSVQVSMGQNVLTKFHEDQTINVASRVFTRQNVDDTRWTTDDGQKAITKAHHEHAVLR
ncbi:hypothetical protein DPMN_150571 [Dreissena polymorpha]|uniref:Uncharacterized protein n=1 Tax=Dreissena polymorpha TaxID=45954 RepID=A0A9D4FI83_DREPO|nr:hypothetical protein DPMN_150571 [Dreissena polymorpha]